MAPAAHSQRNAAEILGQAVKPPERIAMGSRDMASQLPRDYSLPGLRQSRRRDNLPATAGRHRDQSSPSPGRHQGDRHTKLRSRGRTKDPARKQDCRSRFPDPESLAGLAGSRPSPAGPAPASLTASGGRSTASSATPSATSPTSPGTPARGQRPSTTRPAPAARTTRTPSASPPAPGSMSSGAAGKTASPTTPPSTTPCRTSWPGSRLAGPRLPAPRTPGDGRGQRRAARLRGRHLPRRSSQRSS